MPFNLKKLIGCPLSDVGKKSRFSEKDKRKCEELNGIGADGLNLIGDNDQQDPDLLLMRKTIEKNPEMFVLNNLMMCVQFFGNFDEEMNQIRQTLVSPREAQFNANLLPQRRALLPDVLQEHVGRKLKFTSARQTLRPTVEPLQPIRVFMVHENLDIAEQNDPHHYATMSDIVTYNLWLKPSHHKGYVYLQHLGDSPVKRNLNTEEELFSIAERSDELYEKYFYDEKEAKDASRLTKSYSSCSLPERLHLYDKQKESRESLSSQTEAKLDKLYLNKASHLQHRFPRSRKLLHRSYSRNLAKQHTSNDSPDSSTSSGYATTSGIDSDSDYAYSGTESISDLSKHTQLPNSCFKMVTYTQSGKIYDPREEHRQNLTSKQKRIKEELRRYNYNVWYVNSTNFMRHFFKLFKQHVADLLGFDKASVNDAKCLGCVIYCDKIDVFSSSSYTKVEPYEIIPSVWSQWPDCAQEFLIRERGIWPDFETVQKIKEFGCYLVPECFVPKRQCNPLRKIEWQLTFPAAERYLETCLSHAQTRVLLIALMLHKTFVRPVDMLLGLSTSHIRNKLFWLIEQNGNLDWPEYRTGECLLKLLSAIYQSISQNIPIMKDYFMKDKNLFQNIPNECLLQSQKQINRIITNPVMYLIYAMENIHYKQSFFPRLDFNELLRILTVDIVPLVNPQIIFNNCKLSCRTENSKYEENCNDNARFWNEGVTKSEYNTISRKSTTNKTLINSKQITKNSIIEIPVRCAELEDTRLSVLLDFFIRHFIQTAQRYHQYKAWKEKTIYITQAERLCILLSERENCKVNVRIYMQKINALKNLMIKVQHKKEPPETPKRNTDPPFFSQPLKDRFVSNPECNKRVLDKLPESFENHKSCASVDCESVDYKAAQHDISCEVTRV